MRIDRLNEMEQYILSQGSATLDELAESFDISVNSVRRDLAALVARGRIKKVYGGASAADYAQVSTLQTRHTRNASEKEIIGRLAATLIEDDMTIFLDSGSTVQRIVPHLASKSGITIVTYSQNVMQEAEKYPNLRLIALGGQYNALTCSFTGYLTLEAISRLSIPIAFMAATGVSLSYGLSNSTDSEAQIKRAIAKRSKQVVLTADHSKFSVEAMISYYNFEDLYAVVSDQPLADDYLRVAEEHDILLLTP